MQAAGAEAGATGAEAAVEGLEAEAWAGAAEAEAEAPRGGDHPEDEEDFYEEEMDVRLSPARGRAGLVGIGLVGGGP